MLERLKTDLAIIGEAVGVRRNDTLTRTDNGALQPTISAFWDALNQSSFAAGLGYTPRLADRIWAANRCIQLNAQMVSRMPLRFNGPPSVTAPAWVSNPDPVYFPNGIGDAIFAATKALYGWGEAFLFVTARYADGFPSAWTVLDPEPMSVQLARGRRQYRSGQRILDPGDVVHVMRDPGGLRGTPALRAYASKAWGAISTIETSRALTGEGAVPNAVLKSQKRLTQQQSQIVQDDWLTARARRPGAPAVLPPEIDFEQLAFSPKDLLLLDSQKFDATVICSAFGVPAYKLNIALEGALVYQNPEALFEDWWRSELRPTAANIASALSAQMLPRGQSVDFDATATIEPNVADKIKAWLAMLAQGAVTVDEFRAAVLSLPPLADGDALAELTQPPVANASPSQQPGTPVTDLKVVTAA